MNQSLEIDRDYSQDAAATRRPLLALLLLLPAPTVGVWVAMGLAPGPAGQVVYGLCKIWLLALPALWLLLVEKRSAQFERPSGRSLAVGAVWGVAIAVVIYGAYALVGRHWIDAAHLRAIAEQTGIAEPWKFVALAIYLILINSLLEEYVWRWFVYRQCEALAPKAAAVALSGFLFTVHHIIALAYQFDWRITALASSGVLIGGVIWSAMYLRYRNVWPGWVSHAIADMPIFWIGYQIIFGSDSSGALLDSPAALAMIGA